VLENTSSSEVKFKVDVTGSQALALGDSIKLNQGLLNLMINGLQPSKSEGVVLVKISRVTV
jgi:phosphoglycerate-specific signal transduction histidine kinase